MMNKKIFFVLSIHSPSPVSDEMISFLNSRNPSGLWEVDPFNINAYFTKKDAALVEEFRKKFPGAGLAWKSEESRDWVKEYEESLNPIKVGKRFVITPFSSLKKVKDRDTGNRTAIKLVPGEAFGTGEHFTTASSIEIMESIKKFPASALDVGTGTGVLAIAAKHLGAKHIYACDIDPVACKVAKETIKLNKFRIPVCVSGPETIKGEFGLVVANILAETIIELSPHLCRLTGKNGLLVLSGITIEMGTRVKETFTGLDYKLLEAISDGEWWTFLFAKICRPER
jgi:ribosomal protein L11 methyltransferase